MFSQLKMPGEVAQEIGAREKARKAEKVNSGAVKCQGRDQLGFSEKV